MYICNEMQKLRNWLGKNSICWEDVSTDYSQLKEQMNDPDFPDLSMCRTHFTINGDKVSVINGWGSYGGNDWHTGERLGLLEIRADKINDGQPIGWLTADEVISELVKVYDLHIPDVD